MRADPPPLESVTVGAALRHSAPPGEFADYICGSCHRTFPLNPPMPMRPGLCARCAELLREQERAALLAKWRRTRAEAFLASCPARYAQSDHSRFPACWQRISAWRPTPGGNGLLLKGKTGRCKTRMLWALGIELAKEGHGVEFVNEASLAHEIAAGMDIHRIVERYLRVDVAILDDLGKSKMTERMAATIYQIIEDRTANARPILASTNLHGDRLSATMHDDSGAVVRRLRDFCEVVEVVQLVDTAK